LNACADVPPPANASLVLPELLMIDAATFRARFRRTPIWRATPEGIARNAAVVLGNLGDPAARTFLVRATREAESTRVREHAAWALTQLKP
jgi:epoxyqueuosine reductase